MKTEPALLPAHRRTLPEMLRTQAERCGEAPLVSLGEVHWRHADAPVIAAARAATLREAGIGVGDRVAVLAGNRAEFLETFLGCGWVGAVMVPINTASMGPQIAYTLGNSGARLLVIEAALLERLAMVDFAATKVETVWVIGDAPAIPSPAQPPAVGPIYRPFPPAGRADLEAHPVQPGDPLAIIYTSGTTGPAKGVVCPHAQYYWWGVNSLRILGITADDVLCTTLPLFHINALNTFAQASVAGCRAVFLPRFSASGFWAQMQANQATIVYLLGAMVPMLLAQPVSEAERQHRVRLGLGPGVPAEACAAFQARSGVFQLTVRSEERRVS